MVVRSTSRRPGRRRATRSAARPRRCARARRSARRPGAPAWTFVRRLRRHSRSRGRGRRHTAASPPGASSRAAPRTASGRCGSRRPRRDQPCFQGSHGSRMRGPSEWDREAVGSRTHRLPAWSRCEWLCVRRRWGPRRHLTSLAGCRRSTTPCAPRPAAPEPETPTEEAVGVSAGSLCRLSIERRGARRYFVWMTMLPPLRGWGTPLS